MSSKKVKFNLTTSPNFIELFASGVVGGMNPSKCSMTFFVDKPQITMDDKKPGKINVEEINRELLAEVAVTPNQFKQIAGWMIKNIQVYEKKFGEIMPKPKDEGEEKALTFIS